MWVFDLDSLRFLAVNEAAIKKYGYAREEFLSMTLKDIRPPEDITLFMEAHLREAGTVRKAGTFRHLKKNGSQIEVEITAEDIQWQGRRAQVVVATDVTERNRAGEVLSEERRLLRTLIDTLPDYIFVKDTQSRFVVVNRAYVELVGAKDSEELLGKTDFDFFPHDAAMAFISDDQFVIHSGKPFMNWEEKATDPQGNAKWVSTSKVPLRNQQGELIGLIGIARDITRRKEAEEKLRAEQEMLRKLIDNIPDRIYVKDLQSRWVLANRELANRLGAKNPEEMLGKTDFDYFPKEVATVFSTDEQTVIRTGRPLVNKEERAVDARGNIRWWSTSKVPWRDDLGQIIGIMGIGRDITRLKSAEENFYKAFNANPEPLTISVVSDGRYLDVNESFLRGTGYSREEVIGRTSLDLKIWDNLEDRGRFIEKLRQHGSVRDLEVPFRVKSGELRVWLHSANLIEFEGQECVISSQKDVTETRALALQLGQAQKMESIGRLAGGVAHDFNNLLSVIIGYSEILLGQPDLDERTQKQFEEIKKAGNRAAALTRQLLAFSRQQILEPKVLNLNVTVVETQKMLRRLIGEDVEFQMRLDPGIGSVKADPGQIGQILMNLAVNGRDAMPDGGRLTIETGEADLDEEAARRHAPCAPGRYVVLTVADTGTGMDEDTKTHIFEPFFTTKELGKGTGLGLSTVYGIVKQSGGYVWVYSELGQGAVFKIFLPRVEQPTRQGEESDLGSENLGGTETVLVVEDEESVRVLICSILAQNGYTVLEANSPEHALEIVRQNPSIDLLLTDVVMPGMNGPAMVEKLEEMRVRMKVLYVSGYAGRFGNDRGLLREGVPFLQKPFSKKELLRRLREILEARVVTKLA
jgi:two-component system, cell cycle sensor histidine kinase and response regulator CckA